MATGKKRYIQRISYEISKGRVAGEKKRRNDNIRGVSRVMANSYVGGYRKGANGFSLSNRLHAQGGVAGRGSNANRTYRAAAIRALRAGATIQQANRAGYRASRKSLGASGG